jgi:hypothetical protein
MKLNKEEAISYINKTIGELVYDKINLIKAYNYYNGFRNTTQFKYLEENFGLGNPTSIQFTPLVRKHIDAIVGEYLETAVLPKVTCKDENTLSAITAEKTEVLNKTVQTYLTKKLLEDSSKGITDKLIENKLKSLLENIELDFVSNYEIAAQNLIEYVLQSRDTDFINKRRQLLLDLLISGWANYRIKPVNNKIDIEILSPLDTFYDVNPNSPYIKNSYRCVIRKWLDKYQILQLYGDKLTKEEKEKIVDAIDSSNSYANYVRSNDGVPVLNGLDQSTITPIMSTTEYTYNTKLLPVYEVEWLETDKNNVMHRYGGIRICNNIFIILDEDENVIRSNSDPKSCGLSVNGLYFNTRSNKAYSLMLACADLQDKYDILIFYRDTIIANSGVQGDWLDISTLPECLGVTFPERLQKWIAYKKTGLGLIDTSQEGRAFNNNTTLAGFDNTVSAQAIQAIEIAIERIENTCSSITGVFRERLNGIQQKDAVTNVKVGVNNSFMVTRQYTYQMDLITVEMLTDCLNVGKIVYKDGLTGALIFGEKQQKIFKLIPKYYTNTDYDVHIVSGADIVKDMELIKQYSGQLISANQMDAELLMEVVTAKSLTELKYNVKKALKAKKEEMNTLTQLQQQVEESSNIIKEYETKLKELQSKIESLNEAKLQLESEKIAKDNEIEWFKVKFEKEQGEKKLGIEDKKVDAELAQMYDRNQYNNKINFNK